MHHQDSHVDVEHALIQVASEKMQVPPEELEVVKGWCRLKSLTEAHRYLPVHEVAETAHQTQVGWRGVRHQLGLHAGESPHRVKETLLHAASERMRVDAADLELTSGWIRLKEGAANASDKNAPSPMTVHDVADHAHKLPSAWQDVKRHLGLEPDADSRRVKEIVLQVAAETLQVLSSSTLSDSFMTPNP